MKLAGTTETSPEKSCCRILSYKGSKIQNLTQQLEAIFHPSILSRDKGLGATGSTNNKIGQTSWVVDRQETPPEK